MSAILLGVAPVFALIALGWALRASKFMPAETWAPVERLTYFAFYPGFLIPAIWTADFSGLSAGVVGASTIASVVIVGALALLARPLLRIDGPAFTSVFQGLVRWNSFVFLPVVAAVVGRDGLGLAAVIIGALIPVINVMCVLVLQRWGEGQTRGWRGLAMSLVKNPVLVACAIGTALNLSGIPPITGLYQALKLLGDGALPLGLIIAGAGLSFRYAATRPATIAVVVACKLVALPVLMWWLAEWMGGDQTARTVALLCGAAPGAAASYVLARQMGGDAPLMAGIVAFTTVGSAVTIPLLLALFHVA